MEPGRNYDFTALVPGKHGYPRADRTPGRQGAIGIIKERQIPGCQTERCECSPRLFRANLPQTIRRIFLRAWMGCRTIGKNHHCGLELLFATGSDEAAATQALIIRVRRKDQRPLSAKNGAEVRVRKALHSSQDVAGDHGAETPWWIKWPAASINTSSGAGWRR